VTREREYEVVIVVSPALEEERVEAILERMRRLIDDRGGTITKEEHWGFRRLAYSINEFREGNYFLMRLNIDTAHINAVNALLEMSEDILRHLVVKLDKKEKVQAEKIQASE
jgi:small subunit ribosomal protein S6